MSEHPEHEYGPEGLPLSVRRYTYRKKDFSQIVDLERERFYRSRHSMRTMSKADSDASEPEDVTEYIIFSIDAATYDRDFLNPNIEPILSVRTTFDQNINSLVAKMVLHEHEEMSRAFEFIIQDVLAPMGLKNSIYLYGATTLTVANGFKQPDGAWGPRRGPPGSPRRPTVVLEVITSETYAKLLRDVGRWLDPLHGFVKIALAVKANCWQPKVTIERWQYNSTKADIEN